MNFTERVAIERQRIRAASVQSASERHEFWVDTCREITEMHRASPQVVGMYQKFGCRFVVPTRQQVEHVLQALDSAMPQWDKQHPELFYQTLELNFPELIRHA